MKRPSFRCRIQSRFDAFAPSAAPQRLRNRGNRHRGAMQTAAIQTGMQTAMQTTMQTTMQTAARAGFVFVRAFAQ